MTRDEWIRRIKANLTCDPMPEFNGRHVNDVLEALAVTVMDIVDEKIAELDAKAPSK